MESGIGEIGDGKHVDEDGDEIGVISAHGGGEVVEECGEVVERVWEL